MEYTPTPKLIMRKEYISMHGFVLLQCGQLNSFSDGMSVQVREDVADTIIRSVNCHVELVEALKSAEIALRTHNPNDFYLAKIAVKQALSKAEK